MRILSTILLTLCVSASAAAQTLGVFAVNDYWITPGGASGGYSCKALTVVTPATITMNVANAGGGNYAILWSTCPCTACWAAPALGSSGCLPPPTTACPSSNQFLEILFAPGCTNIVIAGVMNAAGFGSIPASIPPTSPPITLGTQTIFLNPPACVAPPFNVLMSQGWNVTFV